MKKGLWGVLEDLVPSQPDIGQVNWNVTVKDLLLLLKARGLSISATKLEIVFENSQTWNPGFPWDVAIEDGSVRFTQKRDEKFQTLVENELPMISTDEEDVFEEDIDIEEEDEQGERFRFKTFGGKKSRREDK